MSFLPEDSMLPICSEEGYALDKNKCLCLKPKHHGRKSRCPKGTRRNKKTGQCEKNDAITKSNKATQKATQKGVINQILDGIAQTEATDTLLSALPLFPRKTRCPKGTRRNKKTGECEIHRDGLQGRQNTRAPTTVRTKKKLKLVTKTVKKKDHPIMLKDMTPPDDRIISNAIKHIVKENKGEKTKLDIKKVISKLPVALEKARSFSPSVNKRLVSIANDISAKAIFGCGAETILQNNITKFDKNTNINIGTFSAPVCTKPFSQSANYALLNNLKINKPLDCSKIITPLQYDSNCWFNTLYVIFFISDKGRKFFRFFRQLMITGQKLDGSTIKPPRLRNIFYILNLCIEATYNQLSNDDIESWSRALNTNLIIEGVYKAIPPKYRDSAIVKKGVANNPYKFYNAIINYLGDSSIYMTKLDVYNSQKKFHAENLFNNKPVPYSAFHGGIARKTPDIICVAIRNDDSDMNLKIPVTFVYRKNTFTLDSAVVRDTDMEHFCALLTCNKKEFGYDGISFSRITPFKWKKLVNKNKKWTFKGSYWDNSQDSIYWNFKKGYFMLYFYRET